MIPQGSIIAHGPGVDGALRPGSRVLPQEWGLQHPRPRQRDGVRRLGHLEDAERPLHQGDDPPVVEEGEDGPRGQPTVRAARAPGSEKIRPSKGANISW
jgi:hypothetical protein